MRLVRQTPEELVLLHRPLLLCVALAAGAVCLLGVSLWNIYIGDWLKSGIALMATAVVMVPALWFGTERVDVVFDAQAGTCSVDTRRLSGPVHETYQLSQIERAMVQSHKGPSDAASAHRVALVLKPGGLEDRRPLTTGNASGSGAADIVAKINGWLAEHRRA
jgi:hypothetical protein